MWEDLFEYDGVQLLRKSSAGGFKIGDPAGALRSPRPGSGLHMVVTVDYKRTYAHRVIWEMNFGVIPEGCCIDHIDGNGLNNRLDNLRVIPSKENQKNMRRSSKCTSGILGVGWHKASQKWRASINNDAKHEHIGLFVDFFDAVCARKSAELRLGYHKNHGGRSSQCFAFST